MRLPLSLLLALALTAPLLAPRSADAIIRRHDIDDSAYVVSADDYPAVVDLLALGDCIATLIRPQWLLTAAHCAVEMPSSVSLSIGASSHAVASVRIPPNWNDDVDDIALLELAEPVTDVEPIAVYEGTEEVGQVIWFVGRGDTSTGLRGQSGAEVDGKTRRASNTIVAADRHWIQFVFNGPEDFGVTPLEGISGDGDSGGPALLVTDEKTWIVGLSSFQDEGGFSLGRYGVEEFYTRVSQYSVWMQEHIGTFDETSANESGEGGHTWADDTSAEDNDEAGPVAVAESGYWGGVGSIDEGGCSTTRSHRMLVGLLSLVFLSRRRWA